MPAADRARDPVTPVGTGMGSPSPRGTTAVTLLVLLLLMGGAGAQSERALGWVATGLVHEAGKRSGPRTTERHCVEDARQPDVVECDDTRRGDAGHVHRFRSVVDGTLPPVRAPDDDRSR